MSGEYWILAKPQKAFELQVKGSRFIASISPADSAAACQQHLNWCQQQWPNASHYCTAAIMAAPSDSQAYAMSDDGEPSGTAGMPMLKVLMGANLGEVSAVVVRYFGGVKLGTGGLQRAYSQALSSALADIEKSLKVPRNLAVLRYAYSDQNVIEHLLARYEAKVTAQNFSDYIEQTLEVVAKTQHSLATDINNMTQGRVQLICKNEDDSCASAAF
ncbi:YigZ family protein [Pseudidiomarina taiwanensis]|uniref:YigZ family protein n=1 Tax=Pseudidiomarina taiwanensis TaxID=337250 RepID=UPI001F54552B|nr:YigZ family protein [Pseudidiomarina taiwanensis]